MTRRRFGAYLETLDVGKYRLRTTFKDGKGLDATENVEFLPQTGDNSKLSSGLDSSWSGSLERLLLKKRT